MVEKHHAIGSQSHSLPWCLRENWLDEQEPLGLPEAQSPMNKKPLDTWALRGAKEHQSLHLLQPQSPKEQFSRSLLHFWRNQLSGTWQVNRTLGFSKMPNQGNCWELLKPLAEIWIIRLIYKYWRGIPLPLLELNLTKPWILATCRDCSKKQFLRYLLLHFLQESPWPYLHPWLCLEPWEWKQGPSLYLRHWKTTFSSITKYMREENLHQFHLLQISRTLSSQLLLLCAFPFFASFNLRLVSLGLLPRIWQF